MGYETKDSGERQVFATGMQRDSGAKELEPGLIPIPMLVRWAELMGRGAAKYEARNWERACTPEELDRFQRSAFRHFVQWMRGDTDEDHAAATFFNIAGAEHVKARLSAPPKEYTITVNFEVDPFGFDALRDAREAAAKDALSDLDDLPEPEAVGGTPYELPREADTTLDAKVEKAIADALKPWEPKVGDRVRVREGSASTYVMPLGGRVGVIEELESLFWLVRLDGEEDLAALAEDELEPLNPSGAV